jgi:alkylation response protein AidB-like acyl-CoA dehydrogenase
LDLRYSEADERFRAELRSWLAEAVPAHGPAPPAHDWHGRREYDTGWQRKLFDAGYAGINWPAAYGGREATLTEQLVYYEEIARTFASAGTFYFGCDVGAGSHCGSGNMRVKVTVTEPPPPMVPAMRVAGLAALAIAIARRRRSAA